MNLHKDKDAFQVLINLVHEQTGYREDVLEKDYYVCLILKELADKQKNGLPAYFKGGTALYKALKTTKRFSEDIDLSVDTRGCNRTQSAKRLEWATKKFQGLDRISGLGETKRSEVIAVYQYQPVSTFDSEDALQRFGKLKVEATSFTISEPVAELEVAPILYEMTGQRQREILISNYDVKPFTIQTITLERIFIDKLFAAESYVRRSAESHRAFEAAKHIYDLAVLKSHRKIKELMSNDEMMLYLLNIRIEEEKERLDGVAGVSPRLFVFFSVTEENDAVKRAYEIMQNQYVLRVEDRISFKQAMSAIKQIYRNLMHNTTWRDYDSVQKTDENVLS